MHLGAEYSAFIMLQTCSECSSLEQPLRLPNLTEPDSHRSSVVEEDSCAHAICRSDVGQS